MKKYLSELHTKPHHHKKRFALLASGIVTLSIFAVWSVVRLSDKPIIVKETTGPVDLAAVIESTDGLTDVVKDIKSAWQTLTDDN
jgi:hypothetical protein